MTKWNITKRTYLVDDNEVGSITETIIEFDDKAKTLDVTKANAYVTDLIAKSKASDDLTEQSAIYSMQPIP